MRNIKVADIMTRSPVTARPDENLLNCARKMVRKKVGSLVLVKNRKFSGIISQRDILWALVKKSGKNLAEIKVMDISPKKVVTIKPKATIQEAIKKMKKTKFGRLPVIEKNHLVGMITARDILNFHPEFYPELEEFSRIREESAKLKRIKETKRKAFVNDGICEECGDRGVLYKTHGMLLCESCRNSI
jgi:CBS domain-containing protein